MRILTVHGWGFCPSVFKNLPPFAEHFSVDHSKGLGENVELLKEIVDSQTLLVGWSLGATLSVLVAISRPVKGLILIGATPHFGKAWKSSYIERFLKELNEDFEGKLEEFRKTAYGETDCPLPPKEGAIRLLKEFIETDISNLLKELQIPTVLLHGKKDTITPYREFKKMLKLNSRFKGLAYDGGHFPLHLSQRDWETVFKSFPNLPPLGPPSK